MAKPEVSLALIDEPSRYDTLETWERHFASLQNLPDNNPLKIPLMESARDKIAEKSRPAV
jgi:hypothetical protein